MPSMVKESYLAHYGKNFAEGLDRWFPQHAEAVAPFRKLLIIHNFSYGRRSRLGKQLPQVCRGTLVVPGTRNELGFGESHLPARPAQPNRDECVGSRCRFRCSCAEPSCPTGIPNPGGEASRVLPENLNPRNRRERVFLSNRECGRRKKISAARGKPVPLPSRRIC